MRYFKISRKHYPQFTRGYIYGYYQEEDSNIIVNANSKNKDNKSGAITRAF